MANSPAHGTAKSGLDDELIGSRRWRRRLHVSAPVTRLWIGFVLGWLPVFAVTAVRLVLDSRSRSRLPIALLLLMSCAALYLGLTLSGSIEASDLGPNGPTRSQCRRRLLLMAAMTSVIAGLVILVPHTGIWWLVMHVIIAAGLALPPVFATACIVVLLALTLTTAWAVSGSVDPMLLILIAFGASAIAVRQLTITVAHLRTAREELARAAVDQERLRFARDLHDLLGHSLSVIILKSELAGKLLPASAGRVATEITDVERAARDALGQVRQAVVGYRQPVLQRELAGARELLAGAGIDAEIEHSAGALPPPIDGLLAWAVREGVTNVVRHSQARRCEIRIDRYSGIVRLVVNDDGRGKEDAPPVRGTGLAGLAERAAVHGAELSVGPNPLGGFKLAIIAPVAGTQSDGRA